MELKEGRDFNRVVVIRNLNENNSIDEETKDGKEAILSEKTLLLTAISKPKRLLEFVPQSVKLLAFADHHNFTKQEIDNILQNYKDYAILTTLKDYVKLKEFDIKNIYLMDLDIKFSEDLDLSSLENYISEFKK